MLLRYLIPLVVLALARIAAAQHHLAPEARADLLARGLEQIPEGREYVRPLLIAGWGTTEQILEAVKEVGWTYSGFFDPFKTRETVGGGEQMWSPLTIPQLAVPQGEIWVEREGVRLDVEVFEIWEFMLCQNSFETNRAVLEALDWKPWVERRRLTPVRIVAAEGSPRLMQWFLDHGADPNATQFPIRANALHHVVRWRSVDEALPMIDALLKAGGEINARTRHADTPLLLGCANRIDHRILHRLLERGADPDLPIQDGRVALHFAAEHQDLELVRLLVEFGADRGWKTKNGNTPDDFARKAGASADSELRQLLTPDA